MKKTAALLTFAMLVSACTPETKVQMVAPDSTAVPAPAPVSASSSNNQIEGTVNGGGGKGVLCKKNGHETLEILDLYEGRVLYGLQYSAKYKSFEEAMAAVTEKELDYSNYGMLGPQYDSIIKKSVEENLERVREKIKFIDSSKSLKSTKDANEAIVEDSCESKQIALYYDENILLINKQLWDKLDFLNQAALILHESVYLNSRKSGDTTSVSSRRYVAHLLSDHGLPVQIKKVPKDKVLVCGGGYFVAWQGDEKNPALLIVPALSGFRYYDGSKRQQLRQSIRIEGITFDEVLAGKLSPKIDEMVTLEKRINVFEDTIRDPVYEYRAHEIEQIKSYLSNCISLSEAVKNIK